MMRSDIYKKVLDLSFENIDRLAPASIITRITNDVTQEAYIPKVDLNT